MSSSEGPPEYELATSPLQMLAGVVITLCATTNDDDDDRDGPDAGPDGIGPD